MLLISLLKSKYAMGFLESLQNRSTACMSRSDPPCPSSSLTIWMALVICSGDASRRATGPLSTEKLLVMASVNANMASTHVWCQFMSGRQPESHGMSGAQHFLGVDFCTVGVI